MTGPEKKLTSKFSVEELGGLIGFAIFVVFLVGMVAFLLNDALSH